MSGEGMLRHGGRLKPCPETARAGRSCSACSSS